MKNIIKSLLAVLVLLTASCSQDHTSTIFDPSGESASAIYFVSEGFAMEYEATATTDEVMVDVYRANATGDVEIPLDVLYSTGADAFITAPTVASFKDGDFKTTLAIQFNNISNFVRGVTYSVTFSEGTPSTESVKKLGKKPMGVSTNVSYKLTELTISASLKLEWEPVYILKDWNNLFVDPATLTDDAYVLDAAGKKQIQGGIFTYAFLVEGTDDGSFLERAKGTNVFRLTNWGEEATVIMNMDLENTYKDENGISHPTFTVPPTATGVIEEGLMFYLSDVMTYSPTYYDYYKCIPCYFDITRGIFNFCVIYYTSVEPWAITYIHTDMETYALDSGIVVYDYATSAAYKGMTVGPDNAAADASFEVKTGADATGFTYALVSGDISKDFAATAEAIVAGTHADAVAVTELGEKGVTPLVIEALEGGAYTLVVVAHDKDKKLTLDGASALYFYFPGLGGGAKDCEFTATLGSYEALGLEFVDGVGDWSAVAIDFASEDLKSLTYFVAAKASVEAALAAEGATAEALLAEYGTALTDEQLATLASAGSIKLPFTGLKANTEQTLLALGTNSFGKSLLVTVNGATADYPEYSGTVKLGDYYMSRAYTKQDESAGLFENVFTIHPIPGYKNTLLVENLAIANGALWYAQYDATNNALVLSGLEYGYEDYGNQFGSLYGYFDAEKTLVYGILSLSSNDGTGPIAFGLVDGKPTTTLATFGVGLFQNATGYPMAGWYNQFTPDATTIVPYVAPSEGEGEGAETASVKKVANKAKVNFGRVPFTSVRITR